MRASDFFEDCTKVKKESEIKPPVTTYTPYTAMYALEEVSINLQNCNKLTAKGNAYLIFWYWSLVGKRPDPKVWKIVMLKDKKFSTAQPLKKEDYLILNLDGM